MNNNEKGKIYEEFINTYINKLDTVEISYLWSDVPEQVLFDVNLINDYNKHRLKRKNKIIGTLDPINGLKDIGIDIIRINLNKKIVFVQCKNYTNTIMVNDLGGFWMMMAKYIKNNGMVYHSTNKLSINIKENITDRIKFVHKPMLTKAMSKIDPTIKLYDYQNDIVKLFNEYYKTDDKAILSMPCGTGKTLVSCYISKAYNVVIFISPLKQFAEQNIDRYKEYDSDRSYLLIDSDGTRDVAEIKKFILGHKKIMLSVTYKSCDIIVQLFDVLNDAFIIVDEFHNLSAKNIYSFDDEINGDDEKIDELNDNEDREIDEWDDGEDKEID